MRPGRILAKRIPLALSIGILSFMALGCARTAKEISRAQFEQLVAEGRTSTMSRGIWYCGTSGDFHYLRHRIEVQRDLFLKIKTNELAILPVRKYPATKSEQMEISSLVPWPPTNQIGSELLLKQFLNRGGVR